MCGSSPLPEAVSASGGTSDGSTPSSSATANRRSSTRASNSLLSGPRLEPAVASGSYPSPAADGFHQRPVFLVPQQDLGDPGDDERIPQPEHEGEGEQNTKARPALPHHIGEHRDHPIPGIVETSRSSNLIPT